MSFVHVARELFMVWSEPRTLVGLCLELRHTLSDDLIFTVLAQLRCMSLEEALMRTDTTLIHAIL